MKAKNWISMLAVSVAMMSLLTACGSSNHAESRTSTSQTTESETETVTEQTTETTGDGKTLVVYYSASGNTEAVANVIAEVTGGDLFELEPTTPYSNADLNWTDDNSRVTREHENENERDVELVSATVENWNSYDTVFVGYPIWWGIAAWPVDGFIEANDFT